VARAGGSRFAKSPVPRSEVHTAYSEGPAHPLRQPNRHKPPTETILAYLHNIPAHLLSPRLARRSYTSLISADLCSCLELVSFMTHGAQGIIFLAVPACIACRSPEVPGGQHAILSLLCAVRDSPCKLRARSRFLSLAIASCPQVPLRSTARAT
jgi:hypothetical protein